MELKRKYDYPDTSLNTPIEGENVLKLLVAGVDLVLVLYIWEIVSYPV
jgi:hypothetical protein